MYISSTIWLSPAEQQPTFPSRPGQRTRKAGQKWEVHTLAASGLKMGAAKATSFKLKGKTIEERNETLQFFVLVDVDCPQIALLFQACTTVSTLPFIEPTPLSKTLS